MTNVTPAPRAPIPSDATEQERQRLLAEYAILDTAAEPLYDDLAGLASAICRTPIAAVTFFDGDRQWFKAIVGADIREADLRESFCTYTTLDPTRALAVADATQDPRFATASHVAGAPHLRAYAGAALLDPDSTPLGTICVFDVAPREFTATELEALEALGRQVVSLLQFRRQLRALERRTTELALANEELDQFGYIVTHDLKAPIRQQSAFAEVIQEDFGATLPDGVAALLEQINQCGHRAHALLEDLNVYLHTTALKGESAGRASAKEVFQSALTLVGRPPEAEVSFVEEGLDGITVPRAPLRHILANLINNGLKYSAAKRPRVEVRATQVDDRVEFTVCDNGPGVPAAERARIFQVFGRGTYADRAPGRGLGLAIAQRLARSIHGTIEVEDAPGGGACFRVSLPAT